MRARGSDRLRRPANVREDARRGLAPSVLLRLALGLALRPEVVMHIPGLTITAFAFIGNLFIPLSGTMLSTGQVTPMFGVAAIARHALTDGYTFSGEHTSLGWAIFNALAWMIGFIFWASRRFARSTGRK